eukprot:scaffold104659_cov69-Phaeocystis_antarctica.AAC.1
MDNAPLNFTAIRRRGGWGGASGPAPECNRYRFSCCERVEAAHLTRGAARAAGGRHRLHGPCLYMLACMCISLSLSL